MVDPYKGTRFEGFTGLGNDGYGSMSQGPMDRVLSDGFFVNDPRRPMPGMRGSSDSGISAVKNILADRNTTPEERSRRVYMGPGKPSPRVGPPPPPLYDTPGSASGIEIKGDPNFIVDHQDISKILGLTPPTQDPDRADFNAFKSTLRDPGDMGRYIAPGEEMSYEDFVKFGRPANLAAAESAGYGGGALLSDGFGNKVSLGSLEGTAEAGGILGSGAPLPSNKKLVDGKIVDNGNPLVAPDMTQRPMPFSGLASLTKLPMFQEFATKLESEHPEASQLFSQMFMGSSQRPMPFQNPFMGMGMGSFHPMMGGMGMGMGGYNPMMGMGGGFNPMMGGMGMGGYSPFMGMNPMMGMSGGGLGSFYPQPSTYGPPQSMPSMGGYPTPPQSSPFGGAMRGYYA